MSTSTTKTKMPPKASLIRPPDEAALEPQVISMGTSGVLRLKQVGAVYFVENDIGHIDVVGGKNVRTEEWKIVAVSKGEAARQEAYEFLHQANVDVMRMISEDKRRATPASGTRARGGV